MKLSEVNLLITGAARGIGNFLALGILDSINSLVVLDNNKELLDNIPHYKNLHRYLCDVTNPTEVQLTVEKIFAETPGINVLINNAGIIHNEPLFNLLSPGNKKHSVENWKKIIGVNLDAVFYVTSNVVEQMISRKNKGIIINISSISSQGNIGQSAYSASKAGVEALTKTWSKELGMFKIRCVCIAPGFFDTPSTRENLNEHMMKKWEKNIPLGRLGQLEELLSTVKYLIENDYFNGKIIQLDGGLTI